MRALLAESFLLATFGAAAGVVLTIWLMPVLRDIALPTVGVVHLAMRPDLGLLSSALGLVLITGLVCGVLPALKATRGNLVAALHAGGLGSTPPLRLRHVLVVVEVAASVLRSRRDVSDYLSDRLTEIAGTVPDEIPTFFLGGKAKDIFKDERILDYERYPEAMWAKPGEKKPNRAALATWGSWVNSHARTEYGRPLFIAMSADLAESTNIAGFMKGFGEVEGWGWYQRDTNIHGALLPQQITEFTNSGVA